MANPSKKKGTSGENEAVTFFRRWWPAERRALRGVNDAGDIAGTGYAVSVKRAETWPVHKWRKELAIMRFNADALGFIMARRNREPWVFIVPQDVMTHLLDAIYGGPE